MYQINIKVNADGTLSTLDGTLRLGTEQEVSRTKLVFEIDHTIEGTIHYVKFAHKKATYLYRVSSSNSLIVPPNVCRYPGRWFISFISSDSTISGSTISGNYAYISEPYEAVVVNGIFGINNESEELKLLSNLIEGSNFDLVIPTRTRYIGQNFMYKSPSKFSITLHEDLQTIGERAFEESNIQSIKFASDGNLSAIYDYAFQKTNDWKSGVAIPRSLSSWGRYAFHNSNVPSIIFESPSKINTFPTYSFAYLQTLTYLELPKGVAGFSGLGQTISYCSSLKTLKLPNTFSLVIQAYHIRDNEELTEIILENGWNCSANFSNCNNLTSSSMVAMFNALKNLTGQTSKTLTLGSTNLSKLTSSQIAIATSKNWTVS